MAFAQKGITVLFGPGVLAIVLCCSCSTPYRPFSGKYGYTEHQLITNEYEVSFLANGYSSYDRTFDFALLRAAEIALGQQAASLIVEDVTNLSSAHTYQTATHYYWTASRYGTASQPVPSAPEFTAGPERSYLMATPSEERVFYRPGVKLKIKLSSESPWGANRYNPAQLRQRLREKYGLK